MGPGSGIKYQGMNNSCPGPSQVIGAGISGDSADRRVMVEEDGTWVPAQLGSDAKAVFNPLLRSLWLTGRACTLKSQMRKLKLIDGQ